MKIVDGNNREKDCMIKKQILGTLCDGPLTSREIFERSKYHKSYKTLTVLLVRYRKYGYIKKKGPKPSLYYLTDLGLEHLEDPFMARKAVVEAYKERYSNAVTRLSSGSRTPIVVQNNVVDTIKEGVPIREGVKEILPIREGLKEGLPIKEGIKESLQIKESVSQRLSPSEGFSGDKQANSTCTGTINSTEPETSELVPDLIEENQRLREENESMVKQLAGRSIAVAETSVKKEEEKEDRVRYYDDLLIKYDRHYVPYGFFDKLPFKLLKETAADIESAGKAVKGYVDNKRKKYKYKILSNNQAKDELDSGYVRELTKAEFNKLKPAIYFKEGWVYVYIKNMKPLKMCTVPEKVVNNKEEVNKPQIRITPPT